MNKSSIQFAVAVIVLVVAVGGYVLWYLTLIGIRTEAEAAATSARAIERENAAVAEAESALAALAADEAAVESYVLSQENIVPFLEDLERKGAALGSSVEVVSVDPGGEGSARITLALRLSGSFGAVMRTFGSFEYAPRDIRLVSVVLDTVPTDPDALWTAAAVFSVAATSSSTP